MSAANACGSVGEVVQRLNKTDLKGRGWTDTMIKRLLGRPNAIETWKVNGYRVDVKLFDLSRVERIEATQEWIAWRAKNLRHAAARSEGAAQATETRRVNEVLSNPNARQALVPLIGARHTFSAKFVRGDGVYLFTDVRYGDEPVADHVWITFLDWQHELPNRDERVEFSAIPRTYRKGYMGHRPGVERGTTCDVQLTDCLPVLKKGGPDDDG